MGGDQQGGLMSKLTIDNIFGDATIDYTCPECSHDFKIKIRQVSKDNSTVQCPGCNANIKFVHTEETKKSQRDMQKAFDDLEKAFENFGK